MYWLVRYKKSSGAKIHHFIKIMTRSPLKYESVIFLPVRPASQTHDSHKGRMILNHVNPAGRIKNCGEKSALKNLQLSF